METDRRLARLYRANLSGITEMGAGVFDLAQASASADSFLGSAGVRISEDIKADSGAVFTPEVRLRYVHDFNGNNPVVLSNPPGISPTVFAIQGSRPSRDFAQLGASVTARLLHQIDSYIAYNGQLSDAQTVHAAEAGLRIRF